MYYVDDLSYSEIAEALDLPIGTVKSRIAYGLETLRRQSLRMRQSN
jgi:DNA-directed RNA polymerase specialized sigma24 family protein